MNAINVPTLTFSRMIQTKRMTKRTNPRRRKSRAKTQLKKIQMSKKTTLVKIKRMARKQNQMKMLKRNQMKRRKQATMIKKTRQKKSQMMQSKARKSPMNLTKRRPMMTQIRQMIKARPIKRM